MMDADCAEDADLCTTAQCLNSICVQTPGPVDDADPCTDDACDPMTGIVSHLPAIIDDADLCTVDACTQQDGITHTPVDVEDGNVCTVDSCDPEGGILHLPSPCNDNNVCTDDACDPDLGCTFTVKPVAPDNLNCTTDTCNIKTGLPVYKPIAACCEHSMCTIDGKLDAASCTYTGANNDCATKVCAAIPGCCNNTWDQACVDAAKDPAICPTGGVPNNFSCTCPHSYCTAGAKLDTLCDPCVKKICEVDPFCCNNSWDGACVAEAKSVCNIPSGMACK